MIERLTDNRALNVFTEQRLLLRVFNLQSMNGFVNLAPHRRHHQSTEQQRLPKPFQTDAHFHADRTQSEKVFLNFQTLGAATATQ